jgi:hypothetical protein
LFAVAEFALPPEQNKVVVDSEAGHPSGSKHALAFTINSCLDDARAGDKMLIRLLEQIIIL